MSSTGPSGFIRSDGTTTCSANIPFAVGARINDSQKLYFGTTATNSYIYADLTPASEGININATDATLSRLYATATNDMRFTTTTGPIYMSSAGGFFLQETVTGNTINVDSTGINALAIGSTADRLAYLNSAGYLVSAATINGNYQWDGTQTIDLTSTSAFTVRRNASGGNVFVVDTTNRQLILGANDANDINIAFDATNDGSIKWDSADETFYVRSNGAPEYIYPTYGASVAIDTYLDGGGARYALQVWGMPTTGASGTAGGFWGGFSDGENPTGAGGGATKNGTSLSEVYGGTFYNYFGATNARTIGAIFGNYIGNEFSDTTNITSTTIRGLYIGPGDGGGSIVTVGTVVGLDLTNPSFSVTGTTPTNTYNIRLPSASTLATNNYGIFWTGASNACWRAGTQAIWSPSANTLRRTANTTHEWYIGANPANATAGTLYLKLASTALTFTDAVNLVFGTTTGSKLGTATTQKIGVWNATPIAQPSAYTQTYSTAAKTNPNMTASTVSTTASTTTTPWGYTTQAQADALPTAINALITDVTDLKKLVNAIIDDFQSIGWLA